MSHKAQAVDGQIGLDASEDTSKKHNTSSKKTAKKPTTDDIPGHKFQPHDLSAAPSIPSDLPPELWTIAQSCPANFTPDFFLETSRNLLENPNLTASHLSRAELSYTSFADATFNPKATTSEDLASIVKHLRPECRPQLVDGGVPGYELEWTVVRKLIPRNPNLDAALMQTCHLYISHGEIIISSVTGDTETVKAERYMVVYIPHANDPDQIPYYHPKVRALSMLYTYLPSHIQTPSSSLSILQAPGALSIYYFPFPAHPLTTRLSRTALKLLEIIHKHSRGNFSGYKKRVHHDQIIPQNAFQDTYAELKGRYAKGLIEGWIEQTPAGKHVFEDLGIAAFLMEVWVGMYGTDSSPEEEGMDDRGGGGGAGGGGGGKEEDKGEMGRSETNEEDIKMKKRKSAQKNFPGFVDIGCGNGLLVYILNAEGWPGWGFDARRRKTWDTFPSSYTDKLRELLLIPEILASGTATVDDTMQVHNAPPSHNGVFPNATFIISNHADELTPWTPLLAYLSNSPFIAIPCCSHDFAGTRFRAPACENHITFDAATGPARNKLPSAYASLVSWVSHLTEAVGYKVEKEHLRIPSTRNVAVLGRSVLEEGQREIQSLEAKLEFTAELVKRETGSGTTIEQVRKMWMKSGGSLLKPSKAGH